MPEVGDNLEVWTQTWDWSTQGDEWSVWWGGTEAMWFGALLPRIHAFIPAARVLEIAPGYGRWTQYLKDQADELVIVDLSENCIDHCRKRFADATNIQYHVNDGSSLEMVADASIDFAFSFDSLVHVEADVLAKYLAQLAHKLTPNGVGFIHHSNIGVHRRQAALARRLPQRVLRRLVNRGVVVDIYAWRAESMTGDLFAEQCEAAGLVCVSQERISWESGHFLIDTLSIFTRRGSSWDRPRQVMRNPVFASEARRMSRLYARTSFPGVPSGSSRPGDEP